MKKNLATPVETYERPFLKSITKSGRLVNPNKLANWIFKFEIVIIAYLYLANRGRYIRVA
jgi:hypothetical protein